MLELRDTTTIYVYLDAVDMRKSIDGLVYLLVEGFDKNPQADAVFVFTNKRRDKVKLLMWDKNGFVLYYKRLERGRFQYSKHLNGDRIELTKVELKALLIGIDFHLISQRSAHEYENFF